MRDRSPGVAARTRATKLQSRFKRLKVLRRALASIILSITIAGGLPPALAEDTIEVVLQKSAVGKPPDNLRIHYYADGIPWGTTVEMEIRGDGTFLRYDQKSGQLDALENRGRLQPEQLKPLFRLLIDIKVWQDVPPGRDGVPDENMVTVTVSAGKAEASVSEWQNDMESRQRLIRVRREMKALVPAGTTSCVLIPKPPTAEVYAKMQAMPGVCAGFE